MIRFVLTCRIAVLAGYLYLVGPRLLNAEDHLSTKWQDYSEDDGRIRVISKYLGFEKQVSSELILKAHGVYDSISGATPTGVPAEDGVNVPLSNLTDVREAGVVDLDWIRGIHTSSFQFSYSSEDDFLSRGYAFSQTTEINQRNTGLNYGIGYIDDLVRPNFFDESQRKDSYDYFVGISQVIDPNTVVALNFTYSDYNGFLSDPYKLKDIRPDNRNQIALTNSYRHFFVNANAAWHVNYRYYHDDFGISSHTFDMRWYQNLRHSIQLVPSVRFYSQSAAGFLPMWTIS